jgi:hypothetical protein
MQCCAIQGYSSYFQQKETFWPFREAACWATKRQQVHAEIEKVIEQLF